MDYTDFFRTLTRNQRHDYQIRVQECLSSSQSVILRAPTGSGKTWAAVAPFLYGRTWGRPIADRLLYALPLRSLAGNLYTSTLKRMRGSHLFGDVLNTGKDRDYSKSRWRCSLQTGAQKDDPFLESDLVFTTIDQLLSSYLLLPVSLASKLGNMNAGALIGSLVVIDELHLLDANTALGTTIEMLDRLSGLCRFVLMSATMPDSSMEWLAAKLNATSLCLGTDEVRALPSHKNKRRTWRWSNAELTAETVAVAHRGKRTIALVNSVARAQNIYKYLAVRFADSSTKVLLLHARFFPEDRGAIEREVEQYFGPDATRTDVILVTTQVIEAGIDLSGDDLHTDIAPMNALIQRAGRIARYVSRNSGTVIVYDTNRLGPYREDRQAVADTRKILAALPAEGAVVDTESEIHWCSDVHAQAEIDSLSRYNSLNAVREKVHDAMDGSRGRLSDLVRNASSVNILVTDAPENLNFSGRDNGRRIGWPQTIGVSPEALYSIAAFFDNPPADWIAKELHISEDDRQFRFEPVDSVKRLKTSWIVALNPICAHYHPKMGLVLGEQGPPTEPRYTQIPPRPRYQYDFEPWAVHAQRIVHQVREAATAHACADMQLTAYIQQLNPEERIAPEVIEQLIEFTAALHDVGKLAEKWFGEAWRWQHEKDARLGLPPRPEVPIAHTTYDPAIDFDDWRQGRFAFPPHAVEGASAAFPVIAEFCGKRFGPCAGPLVAISMVSAIARHHSARAENARDFRIAPTVNSWREAVSPFGVTADVHRSPVNPAAFTKALLTWTHTDKTQAWPIYTTLIRRLRLADQGAVRSHIDGV